jgi:hypothetical protein
MLKKVSFYRLILPLSFATLFLFSACHYRRGDAYTWSGTADTVAYFVKSKGRHLNNKLTRLMWVHENKLDDFKVIYLSDSLTVGKERSILLFSTSLPDIGDDLLQKGFMGTFSSRQVTTYLVVTRKDMKRYLKPLKKP